MNIFAPVAILGLIPLLTWSPVQAEDVKRKVDPTKNVATAAVKKAEPTPKSATADVSRAMKEIPALSWMKTELNRTYDALKKADPPVYYLGYTLYFFDTIEATALPDSLSEYTPHDRSTGMKIELRVGNHDLDNYHSGESAPQGFQGYSLRQIPWYPGEEKTLRHDLWYETEIAYRQAAQDYGRVLASRGLSHEPDNCNDFSVEKPVHEIALTKAADAPLEAKPLIDEIQALAQRFKKFKGLESPSVYLKAERIRRYMENTEGTVIADEKTLLQLSIKATKATKDGELIDGGQTVYYTDMTQPIKDRAALEKLVDNVAESTIALAKAPRAEPFCGPVMLKGSATAVLFHEVLGHRLESSRHRDEQDGKTFTSMLGQKILPTFISVYDRPLISSLNGQCLSGHYNVDDEGVAAQNVTLVKDGKLVGFLVSRRPVPSFSQSNGHGRANSEQNAQAESRMSNFMVESTKTVPEQELRRRLIAEARKQKKPYGLLIERVDEGETQTSNYAAQVFQVTPSMVKRVYVDGRPDELVRGLRIIGTPMSALQRIVMASDHTEVFNGVCGADSGWVPQSNCAPAILIDYLETERAAPDNGVARILPPPGEGKGFGTAAKK